MVQTSDPNLFVLGAANGLRIFDRTRRELQPGTFRQVGDVVTAMAYDAPTNQLGIGTASGGVEVWKLTKSPTPALKRVAAAVPSTRCLSAATWTSGRPERWSDCVRAMFLLGLSARRFSFQRRPGLP